MTVFAVTTTVVIMFIMRARMGLPLLQTVTVPEVYGAAFFVVPAAISMLHPKLRWVQVVTFLLVGFATAYATQHPSLTPATWVMAGLLLAWHYGLFTRQPVVRATIILTVFVLLWSLSVVRGDVALLSSINLLGAGILLFFVVWIIVVYRAREARRRATELESTVEIRTAALQLALDEKNKMIREIHHQTKNNLQMIAATLSFEADANPDGIGQAELHLLSSRIHMLGRVQEQLLASEPFGTVKLATFVEQSILEMHSAVDARNGRIRSHTDVWGAVTSEVAMQLGYVLVEVAFMAAFLATPGSGDGRMSISCTRDQNDAIQIELSKPTPEGVEPGDEMLRLGTMVVQSIVERAGGTTELSLSASGVRWFIVYPLRWSDDAAPDAQRATATIAERPSSASPTSTLPSSGRSSSPDQSS